MFKKYFNLQTEVSSILLLVDLVVTCTFTVGLYGCCTGQSASRSVTICFIMNGEDSGIRLLVQNRLRATTSHVVLCSSTGHTHPSPRAVNRRVIWGNSMETAGTSASLSQRAGTSKAKVTERSEYDMAHRNTASEPSAQHTSILRDTFTHLITGLEML